MYRSKKGCASSALFRHLEIFHEETSVKPCHVHALVETHAHVHVCVKDDKFETHGLHMDHAWITE